MAYKSTGKPMGRPKKVVEVKPETVIVAMAEKQVPKVEIAALLNISIDTFDRRYAEIYATAKVGGRAKLREQLFKMAFQGNTQVTIFLAKTVLGMKEVSGLEISTPEGQAVIIDDARTKLEGILAGIAAKRAADASTQPAQ